MKTDLLNNVSVNPFQEAEIENIDDATQLIKLDTSLTKEERQQVDQIKNQIKTLDNENLLYYGANAQMKLSTFSHNVLNQVQKQEINDIGKQLDHLMNKLNEIDPDAFENQNKHGIKKLFNRFSKSVNELFSRFQSVASQVDRISVELEQSKNVLMHDVKQLDHLYEENKQYFDALQLLIIAAEEKREEIENTLLPQLENEAKQTNNQMKIQDVSDLKDYINRLDKRIYDLKLSRQITLQSAPQIRMIQQVNQSLAEKIQSSILTSIPLWKNQMAIAMSLLHQQKALKAQTAVTDTTNQLLLKNAEMLKTNTIKTAHETERGIVEIETLKKTQSDIVETIQTTLKIQEDGKVKRRQAEQELAVMEQDLKQQLLNIKNKG